MKQRVILILKLQSRNDTSTLEIPYVFSCRKRIRECLNRLAGLPTTIGVAIKAKRIILSLRIHVNLKNHSYTSYVQNQML